MKPSWLLVLGVAAVLAGVLAAGFTTRQCLLLNGRFQADARNPYVYVHGTTEFSVG